MNVLGIDLGLSGALAIVAEHQKCLGVWDMPTSVVAVGKRTRGAYDFDRLSGMMGAFRRDNPEGIVVCEDIYHLGFRGSLAARSAGIAWGAVRMWCASHYVRLLSVSPSEWKRVVLAGRAKGKGASRAKAEELFPGVDLGRRHDEGRAEALLLAYYGHLKG